MQDGHDWMQPGHVASVLFKFLRPDTPQASVFVGRLQLTVLVRHPDRHKLATPNTLAMLQADCPLCCRSPAPGAPGRQQPLR